MNDDFYPGNGISYLGPSGELLVAHPSENGYYQIESPPCYTIATGLPTYDEALQHNNHRQNRCMFGMKFVYPSLMSANQEFPATCWEKDEMAMTYTNNNKFDSDLNGHNKKLDPSNDILTPPVCHQLENVVATSTLLPLQQSSICKIDNPTASLDIVSEKSEMTAIGRTKSLQNELETSRDDNNICTDIVIIS